MRDKILFRTNDETARQQMLEEEDLTLEKAVNICRSIKVTKARMQYMSNEKINSSLVQEIKKDRYPSFSRLILRFPTSLVDSVTSCICPDNAQHIAKLVENVESITISRLFAEVLSRIRET